MSDKEIITPEQEKELKTEKVKVPTEPRKGKNSKLKYAIYILIVVIVTVVAVILSVGNNYKEVFKQLGQANMGWLIIMCGVMLGSILLEAFILFVFARLYSRDYKYHQALAVEQIGVFYSDVTPGATGGQFMEAYTFQKQGLQVSNAVSMLAMYSIVYQLVLSGYGILAFVLKFNFLNEIGGVTLTFGSLGSINISIWALTIIGFLLNIGLALLLFLMSYWKKFHNFIMGPCVGLLDKIHIVKNADKTRENLKVQVENFKIELRRLFSNIPFTILVTIFFILLLTLRFSLPYFAGLALGNQSTHANFFDGVLLSNYHQMVTGIIPIPGAAGVTEYFFLQLFVNTSNPASGFFYMGATAEVGEVVASSSLASAALLLWRTVSFTFPLVVSGFVTAFYRTKGKPAARITDNMPNRQTMIDIIRETLVERENELNMILTTATLSKEAISKRLNVTHKKDEKIVDHTHDNDDFTEIDI